MAAITRCDECKKLSDEQGIGFIGKRWIVMKYKDILANIHTRKDLCATCLKKMVADGSIGVDTGENND